LPHEIAQRLRRDLLTGLALLVVAVAGVLLVDVLTDPVTWQIDESGAASLTDGTPCELYRVAEVDAPPGVGATMLDCGPRPATSTPVIVQQLLVAVGAAGALLLMGGLLCRILASRMPQETLRVPAIVLGLVGGVVLAWWGLRATGEHLVYEVSDGVTSAVLAGGTGLDLRGVATAAGFGLVTASLVRSTRP
jgi:hypothetical protein